MFCLLVVWCSITTRRLIRILLLFWVCWNLEWLAFLIVRFELKLKYKKLLMLLWFVVIWNCFLGCRLGLFNKIWGWLFSRFCCLVLIATYGEFSWNNIYWYILLMHMEEEKVNSWHIWMYLFGWNYIFFTKICHGIYLNSYFVNFHCMKCIFAIIKWM